MTPLDHPVYLSAAICKHSQYRHISVPKYLNNNHACQPGDMGLRVDRTPTVRAEQDAELETIVLVGDCHALQCPRCELEVSGRDIEVGGCVCTCDFPTHAAVAEMDAASLVFMLTCLEPRVCCTMCTLPESSTGISASYVMLPHRQLPRAIMYVPSV